MKRIAPRALAERLRIEPALPLIDVRTPSEFARGHAMGAKLIPLDELTAARFRAEGYALDQTVFLFCRFGSRAERAAERLLQAGYADCIVVEGGTQAWQDAKLPLEKEEGNENGSGHRISLERQVRIGAGVLVLIGLGLGYGIAPGWLWFSAAVGCGLIVSGVTDWCGMALLLARAPWNQKKGF